MIAMRPVWAVAVAADTHSTEAGVRAWQAARATHDIQFAPVAGPAVHAAEAPAWLTALMRFLARLLAPLGEVLGRGWNTVELVLVALAVIGALWIAGTLIWRWWQARTLRRPEPVRPVMERGAALALLDDADALAAQGRFGEAARLLLQRSVHHIARTRPDWLTPSSTAREIGTLAGMPGSAQQAFAVIAREVELSLYALRALAAEDWQRARTAYTAFALTDLGGAA
jgi:hypothetical protein